MASKDLRARTVAITEVVLVFALVHLAFRSVKQFTSWGSFETESGLNFAPGVIMIAVSIALIALRRRSFTAYGVTREGFFHNLNVGVVCGVVLGAGGLLLVLAGVRIDPSRFGPFEGLAYAAAAFIITCGLLWVLNRPPRLRPPPLSSLTLIVVLLAAPLLGAVWRDRPSMHVLLMVLWLFFCAGVGEEVFFRGYIQSRLNQAFGRPFRLLGVRFGVGLILASLLFGLVHALNTVDYFGGSFRFAWWHGFATLWLPYGFLREKTGSVVAPAVAHGVLVLLTRMPSLLG